MKRVVITGMGLVSSIGNCQEEVLANLKAGRSGIVAAPELRDGGFKSQVWGAIQGNFQEQIERKKLRFMNTATSYAFVAMQEAIADAGLTAERIARPDVGLIVGTGGGSMSSPVQAARAFETRGIRGVGPYMVPRTMCSGTAACLATFNQIQGISYSISSACATSSHCIGHAAELIQLGKQSIVFAGGADEVHLLVAMQFDAMGALTSKYNHAPSTASRPYDRGRDGFAISGGAGLLVLEELSHAESRKAKIYAELVGYGATSDGYDMVAPSGEGAARCMELALKDLKQPIDYLNTHGTGTQLGDLRELDAVANVFKDLPLPQISSTKSMTGHALGAAGVHEAIYALLMLNHQFIAPSINIDEVDPAAVVFPIVTSATPHRLRRVMSNSFGFGGANATLVFEKV